MIVLICYTIGHIPHIRDLGNYLNDKGLRYSILTNLHTIDAMVQTEEAGGPQEASYPVEVNRNPVAGLHREPTALGLALLPITRPLFSAAQSFVSFLSLLWPRAKEILLLSQVGAPASSVTRLTQLERKKLLLSASVVIVPEFNFFYNDLNAMGSVLRKNKKVFQIPYSLVNEKEWLTNLAPPRSLFGRVVLSVLELAGSKWVRRFNGELKSPGLRYLLGSILARVDIGNPWLLGDVSGITTVTLGRFQHKYLSKAGYEKGSLVGAEHLNFDELWNVRRTALSLAESAGSQRILTILLPPNQFNSIEEYKHRIVYPVQEAVNRCLLGNWSVRHAPHPRLLPEEEALWSLTCPNAELCQTNQPVSLQIAESSLVLGFSSALLRFCVDLHVPCIDFDVFKLRYEDYSGEQTVSTAASLSELQDALLVASKRTPRDSEEEYCLNFPQQNQERAHDLGDLLRAKE